MPTTSTAPVLEASWLRRGAHINTIGPKTTQGSELGVDVAERAGRVVTDSLAEVASLGPSFFLAGSRAMDRLEDLAPIVAGQEPSRTSVEDVTLFCGVGLAGTDVLIAAALLGRAEG